MQAARLHLPPVVSRDPAQSPSEIHHRGRPRGGLRHEWGTALAMGRRLNQALKEHGERLGWSIASGVLGACIGLGMVTLWLHWSR